MTRAPHTGRRPGIASFADDVEDLPVPTSEQIAAAKAGGEGLGFRSEKPAPSPEPETPPAKGNGREPKMTANFHIRVRPEDRQRFDDFAYRHRMPKGEAMRYLIDLAEIGEAVEGEKRDEQ